MEDFSFLLLLKYYLLGLKCLFLGIKFAKIWNCCVYRDCKLLLLARDPPDPRAYSSGFRRGLGFRLTPPALLGLVLHPESSCWGRLKETKMFKAFHFILSLQRLKTTSSSCLLSSWSASERFISFVSECWGEWLCGETCLPFFSLQTGTGFASRRSDCVCVPCRRALVLHSQHCEQSMWANWWSPVIF